MMEGAGLVGQDHHAAGTGILIVHLKIVRVVGSKIIRDGKPAAGGEFQVGVAIIIARGIWIGAEISVAGCEIQIVVAVDGGSASAHPDASATSDSAELSDGAVWRGAKDMVSQQVQVSGIIA